MTRLWTWLGCVLLSLLLAACPGVKDSDDDDSSTTDDDDTGADDDDTGHGDDDDTGHGDDDDTGHGDDDDTGHGDDDDTGHGDDDDSSGHGDDDDDSSSGHGDDDDDSGAGDDDDSAVVHDLDGDGFSNDVDCDETNINIYPGAPEVCNGLDDDCDATTTAVGGEDDVDSDGAWSCEDCDDNDANRSPWFTELCDGIDNDCSGTTPDTDVTETVVGGGAGTLLPPSAIEDTAVLSTFLDWDGVITDVDIYVELSASVPEDLDIFITSPDGTTIELATDVGVGAGDFGFATFDDDAPNPITTEPAPFALSYQPEEPLFLLNGQGAGGTWILEITDDDNNGSTGSVVSWSVLLTMDGTQDTDGDTFAGCMDCNDGDSGIFPGAPEICDGWDTDCNGVGDATPLGSDATCPAESCQHVADARPLAADGVYWIDPGAVGAFETFCDLNTTAGGGWTLAAHVADAADPYFLGTDQGAWTDVAERNASMIPTYSADISVSAKYRTWSELTATDLLVYYKSDGSTFVCYGLAAVDDLAGMFSIAPSTGACAVQCSAWEDTRLPAGSTMDPAGLNCSDLDQGWYTTDTTAQNARIGGYDSAEPTTGMNAFVGGMGTRTWTNELEHTWGDSAAGVVAEDGILIFVR